MVAALVAVGLMVRTRMKGSPEIRAQQHYDHCHQAMLVMGGCIFGIAVPPVVFTVLLPSYIMVGNTPLTIREGVFVGVLAGLSLIPAIIGYQVDKTVLKSKIEFDSLIWATAVDTGAVKRAEMLQDIEALEAAKFGGLIAPSDLARQGLRGSGGWGIDPERRRSNHFLNSNSSSSNSSSSSSNCVSCVCISSWVPALQRRQTDNRVSASSCCSAQAPGNEALSSRACAFLVFREAPMPPLHATFHVYLQLCACSKA
ncbi:hypothetical protein Esti_003332 [Eimeria stiedai]